jgi:hypothetical protein
MEQIQHLTNKTRNLIADEVDDDDDDDNDGSTIQYDDIRFIIEYASKFSTTTANVSISRTPILLFSLKNHFVVMIIYCH